VAHFARTTNTGPDSDVNIGGMSNVLDAMAEAGTRRVVFASSPHALRPSSVEGRHFARVEEMLAGSGAQWVAIRSALVLGRNVDNWALRVLAAPIFPDVDASAGRKLQVVHADDALRVFIRAILDIGIDSGPVNLAAPGEPTFAEIAAALGRPVVPVSKRLLKAGLGRLLRGVSAPAELNRLLDAPLMDTTRLRDTWGLTPAWLADECVEDFALAVRGRITLGNRVVSLPWKVTNVQDVPAADAPAPDGTVPFLAGPEGGNGEFDTPIDPRFPTFLATNLSEALPGPFSPSSASVAVRGLRAGGVCFAEQLRPGGLIGREIATRTVGVFAHRVYGAITTGHFTAEVVPFVKPETVFSSSQFFGPSLASLPILGEQRLPAESRFLPRQLRTIRNIGVFGVSLIGLSATSGRDTRDYLADINRLEHLVGDDLTRIDDRRLLSLILLARDHVVHGWVLAAVSFMLSAAFSVILRGLGSQIALAVGPALVSARPLAAVHRLVAAARRDPTVMCLLAEPGKHLDALGENAPQFYVAFLEELALIGHRGPAEVEMRSTSYADNPELLIRMVAKSLNLPTSTEPHHPRVPLQARPVALLAVRQLRDREVRRDKMVRTIWVLRGLLREYGRRLTDSGVFSTADDVFYLLVDELDALPPDASEIVARRRAEQRRLAHVVPPAVFSGSWQPENASETALAAGETLRGLGVCGGRVRGRVRIVRPETIDDLESGEILVAQATDVGYTPAFSYAAAVVTELGGPMSHAAVVAREFGFPCVVDVHGATRRLAPGAFVEVDGGAGEILVLDDETNLKAGNFKRTSH
jgi:phosphohistidine swiveling domain-containing protein